MISLLFAALASAAPPVHKTPVDEFKPLWSVEFKGERPEAAFFDAASGAIFVSIKDKKGGHLVKVSQAGKVEAERFAESIGPPGALRAFDGKIYWVSGYQVESKGNDGLITEGTVPAELGMPQEIAVDRGGSIYVGTSTGNLVRLQKGTAGVERKGRPITGLFLYQDTLHILRGKKLEALSLPVGSGTKARSVPFTCPKECRGLERTGGGKWLTVNGNQVIEEGPKPRILYQAPAGNAELGRPAYVYQMNAEDEFFVLPLPYDGVIRAFRVNAASK